jgi:mRNA-degrading endonuclease RelE of RelBE toxin-antitoxin system
VNARATRRFERSYAPAPARIRKLFDQKLVFLLQNLRHPSLRAKKYDEAHDIWQARVNGGWRFYFTIEGDTYHLIDIVPQPK